MKRTKYIFRLLLMTVALLGINTANAEVIWTGTANSTFTVNKENFANITANDKIQITVSDLNIYYWSLGVDIDGETNNTANLVSNWRGESYGYQTNNNNNLVDGSYLELQLNDDGVDAVKANGLTLKDHNGITITSVAIVSGDGPVVVKYVLTYVVDGNTVKTEKLEAGATPTPPADPTKEHYTFTGWKNLPQTMPEEDVTVIAEFMPNVHTVSYYINDELYDTQEVAYGTAIVPITPVLTGYKFNGWGWYPETMPDEDIIISGTSSKLYSLTLVYDETLGTVTADMTADIEGGSQINVTVTPVEGYEVASVSFASADGSTPNSWGSYTVQFGTSDITCTVTFRKAAAVTYNIWNGNVQGGTVTANPTTAEAGTTVTLTLSPYNDFVLETLTVRDQSGNSIEVNDNQFVMPASNVWIDATFVASTDLLPKHTLTTVVNDQTTTMELAEGTALSSVLPTPILEGYNFTGWIGMPEDGKMPTSDLTLTAQFAIVYKVEIAATTYGIIITDKEAYEEGETVTVTITANNGYEMESISTNPTNLGLKRVDDGVFSFTMPASDVKVTVRFNAKQYTLTFMLNGEVYVVNENVRYGDNIVLPQDPEVEEGFSFPGWIDVPETMPADNFTIYGHYIATLSVGESGYATYCPMKPIIFQGNENVKAFIAKEKSATEVTLKQVRGAVAAGTGLVLKGEPGAEAVFEVTNVGTSYSGTNMMVGVTDTNATINEAYLYVLVQKTDGVKFADTAANAAIVPVGKAYLHAPANSSRILTISFDDETTAMKGVSAADTEAPTAVYNLSGQRVTSPKAGLYIMNGKKVVIK